MVSVPRRRRAPRRRPAPIVNEPHDLESSISILVTLVGIVGLILALIWVMNLESRLPSIRIGAQEGTGSGAGQTLEPGSYQAENSAILLSGNWFKQTLGTSSSAIKTSSMVTSVSGSSMTFRFYGTEIGMTARIGPESGKVYITVDDQASPILPSDSKGSFIDLYSNQAENQSISIATGLAHKDHTVRISAQGTGEVAISGFDITANTPFPWAFIFLYVSLTASLFVLVRRSAIEICKRIGWL